MAVRALGYLGFEVASEDAWRTFAEQAIGLDWPDRSEDGAVHLRIDDWSSRLQFHEGAADDLAYIGWETGGMAELATLKSKLEAANYACEVADTELLKSRKVADLFWVADPFGNRTEFFYGAERQTVPPTFSLPVRGFVTGEQGLGHFILNVPDVEKARSFYMDVLNFRLSDYIRFEPFPGFEVDITFLRCNGRHHSLALASFPFPKRLQHFLLQYSSLDDVGTALDRAQAKHAPITLTLGRHSNDHMTSFYQRTPSGFEVELGYGGLEVDEPTWTVQLHRNQSVWGHKPGPGMPPPPRGPQG